MNTITNDLAVTIGELESFYEVENIYSYIAELVEIGDYETAHMIAIEAKDMLNYSYTDLRDSIQWCTIEHEDAVIKLFFD